MWWIFIFIFVIVLALLWPRSLKQRVIEAQKNASAAAKHARELYEEYLRNPDKN